MRRIAVTVAALVAVGTAPASGGAAAVAAVDGEAEEPMPDAEPEEPVPAAEPIPPQAPAEATVAEEGTLEALLAPPGAGWIFELNLGGITSTAVRNVEDSSNEDYLLGFGARIGYRNGIFVLGAKLDLAITLYGGQEQMGLFGGAVIQLGSRARLELTADGGFHGIQATGRGPFVEEVEGETTATTLYAGGRAALAWRPGKSIYLSLWAAGSRDLTHERVDVTITSCFWSCNTHDESYIVGGTNVAVGLGLGWGRGF
jgi:hypothetical protein